MSQSGPFKIAPSQQLSNFHDALVLTGSPRKLYRFAHVPGSPDFRDAPTELRPEDEGFRKVVNLAEGDGCHMALATLPIREEPASEFLCCYLTNTGRITFSTPWVNELDPVPPDLLIVNSASKVFHFERQNGGYANKPCEELVGTPKEDILNLVEPDRATGAEGDTIAVALVPGKANPTTRPAVLINAPRLEFVNPWTSAAWAQHPHIHALLDTATGVDARVVFAVGRDKLFDVTFTGGQASIKKVGGNDATRIAMQLGNGMVLGGVKLADAQDAVNLINLPALRPGESAEAPLRILLATATGSVLNFEFDPAQVKDSVLTLPLGDEVDFKQETEAWRLLRNGCIAGAVTLSGRPSLLVNLSAFSPLALGVNSDPEKYSGTYDFRWKPGSRLKVVVQKPEWLSEPKFVALRDRIGTLAGSWTQNANIELEFHSGSDPLAAGTEYDILVNLEDFPVTTKEQKVVKMASSDLGSYASRQSFAVPTMFLGWYKGLKDTSGTIGTRTAYFASAAFEHIVLHEFGHALGLPHLHQHPDLTNPFQASIPNGELDRNNLPEFGAMKAEVERRMGLVLDSQTILEEFILRWPRNIAFSDWPTSVQVQGGIAPQEFLDSVMMALPVRGILAGQSPGPLTYRNTLSDFDKQWLAQVYP